MMNHVVSNHENPRLKDSLLTQLYTWTDRRLGAKGSYLTLVRVADRILYLRGYEMTLLKECMKTSANTIILSTMLDQC